MFDPKQFRLIDYLDFVVKRKELLLVVFLSSLVVTYLVVFIFIDEAYEATAVIIPREEDAMDAISGLLQSARGLPLNLGTKSVRSETDLYEIIIHSRTMMEDVIAEFHLLDEYGIDTTVVSYMEGAVKILQDHVKTQVSEEAAFLVKVRAKTRERAAVMTNYIVQKMNERIIELNSGRSRENRLFLEKRVEEITHQLHVAEDSLRAYQERTGLLDTKVQLEGILTAHTTLESELAALQVQRGVLERISTKESPQVRNVEIQIDEITKKLTQLRNSGEPGSPILALRRLPETAAEYLRRYRDVEIGNLLLRYIVPLYEQAKVDEKKDYPILQIIDYAVPPAKKSYPPRTLFALLGACSITLIVILTLMTRATLQEHLTPDWLSIIQDAKKWNWRRPKTD